MGEEKITVRWTEGIEGAEVERAMKAVPVTSYASLCSNALYCSVGRVRCLEGKWRAATL